MDGNFLVRRQLIILVAVILVIMLLIGVMVPVVYTGKFVELQQVAPLMSYLS